MGSDEKIEDVIADTLSDQWWSTSDHARLEKVFDRITAALERERAEVIELRAEVREWLCVKCRTVYPGPPRKGFACVQCPKCLGDCGPRTFMEKREMRAEVLKVAEEIGLIVGKFPGWEPESLKLQPAMVPVHQLQEWVTALEAAYR